MPIPDYQTLMLPLMRLVAKHDSIRLSELTECLSNEFNLSEEERQQTLPSGRQRTISNRVGWAKTYLLKAGLLNSLQRGVVNISQRGKDVLSAQPDKIDKNYLRQFPEFLDFYKSPANNVDQPPTSDSEQDTPEEVLEKTHASLKDETLNELLAYIKSNTPEFFETLVVRVIVEIGYGGSLNDAGRAVGKSGDGGIDGIIKEDKLGLDVIYLQAKRWEGNVGRPEIQKFVGALHGRRAKKGIFITTSSFTSGAIEYVKTVDPKVILISGYELVNLMWEYGVGLACQATYEIKKINIDYFNDL